MSVLEAVVKVLAEAGRPLHVKDITERILSNGLWSTSGKTPAATVAASMYVSIKGGDSPIRQVGRGVFALREKAPDPVPSPGTMGFLDAAYRVLRELAGGKPMHYGKITEEALARGWLATEGKTPEATMGSQLGVDIRRGRMKGAISRFVSRGNGFYGLREWSAGRIPEEIEKHNSEVADRLLAVLMDMDPRRFEGLVAEILAEMGFEDLEVTPYRHDGGVDVRGVLLSGEAVRTRMAVQVKRVAGTVGSPIVQQVRGSLGAHEQGLVITTGHFSKNAAREAVEADKTPISLMDGKALVDFMLRHGIGVVGTELPPLYDLDPCFGKDGDGA